MANWINESTSRTDLNCDHRAVGSTCCVNAIAFFHKVQDTCWSCCITSSCPQLWHGWFLTTISDICCYHSQSELICRLSWKRTTHNGSRTADSAKSCSWHRCWSLNRKRKQHPSCQRRIARWQEGEGIRRCKLYQIVEKVLRLRQISFLQEPFKLSKFKRVRAKVQNSTLLKDAAGYWSWPMDETIHFASTVGVSPFRNTCTWFWPGDFLSTEIRSCWDSCD